MMHRLSLAAGALLGGLAVFMVASAVNGLWLLPRAREQGRQEMRVQALERAIELVHERNRTDANVQKLDDAGICRELGGVFRDDVCH